MICDCLVGRSQTVGITYKYVTREASSGGRREQESKGECGNAATMTKEILLNCFQVRDCGHVDNEGAGGAVMLDGKKDESKIGRRGWESKTSKQKEIGKRTKSNPDPI